MNVTVFTSNQPRHLNLINSLAEIFDEVYAVQEVTTLFPGEVADFYQKTDVMQRYFANVMAAEKEVFGDASFVKKNVRTISMKFGDLNKINPNIIKPALNSDRFVVFGSSYIKGELCDHLVQKNAVNIHMGISPYFRGNSCNFWALQKGYYDYVGATIHKLTKGLDSGPMLFHTLPKAENISPFVLGMKAVKVAHDGLVDVLSKNKINQIEPVPQNRKDEIFYSKKTDFTDQVAQDFLDNPISNEAVNQKIKNRDLSKFYNAYVG